MSENAVAYGTDTPETIALVPVQESLLFRLLAAPDGTGPDVYNVQFTLEISGPLDAARLRAALGRLLARHPHLRAGLNPRADAEASLVVLPRSALPWRELDLSHGHEDSRGAAAGVADSEYRQRFSVPGRPLLGVVLVELAADLHHLVVTHHHILFDEWSRAAFVEELFALYGPGEEPPAPTRSLRDYTEWLDGLDRTAAERAWRDALTGPDRRVPLAALDLGPTAGGPDGGPLRLVRDLSAETTAGILARCAEHGIQPNTVVQGVWAVLLSRLTGRPDVSFGGIFPDRSAGAELFAGLIGPFTNVLPVRARIRPGESLLALLTRLEARQRALGPHQYLGLPAVARCAGTAEPFDTLAVLESAPLDPARLTALAPELRVTVRSARDANHCPLSCSVVPGDTWRVRLDHRPDTIPAGLAEGLLDSVCALLQTVAGDPDLPVDSPGTLSARLRARITAARDSSAATADPVTFPALFEARVRRSPRATAVVSREESLTFAALNSRANRLARELIGRGVGPGRIVALAMNRCTDLVVSVLAVLKAGGAYLPVDPGYPPPRVSHMLSDARPSLLMTTGDRAAPPGLPVLRVDDPALADRLRGHPDTDPDDTDRNRPLLLDDCAYVIYTSGSSGLPKGVLVPHAGIANLAWEEVDRFAVDDTSRVLQLSSPSFDAAVLEVTMAFAAGAALVVPPSGPLAGEQLADVIEEFGVTHALIPPASLASLPTGRARGLRTLVVGGDACPGHLVGRWSTGRRMVNAYGPTEITVAATISEPLAGSGAPPMGEPVRGARVHLLGPDLLPVEVGVPGEIYVGGAGVARGYLGQAALTAERFVADPYGPPGSRMYRTGDLASLDPDGRLVFRGRADDQVKVRGHRIEPGEIETVLASCAGVGQAAVTVQEEPATGRQLVAFVVTAGGSPAPTADTLRAHASAVLPAHMVPTRYAVVASLPLTPSGKLDRRALPGLDVPAPRPGPEISGPVERLIADAFVEALRTPDVGSDSDFFELGGDSITATGLISALRRAGLRISPRDLFMHRTIGKLAANVTSRAPAADAPARGDATQE